MPGRRSPQQKFLRDTEEYECLNSAMLMSLSLSCMLTPIPWISQNVTPTSFFEETVLSTHCYPSRNGCSLLPSLLIWISFPWEAIPHSTQEVPNSIRSGVMTGTNSFPLQFLKSGCLLTSSDSLLVLLVVHGDVHLVHHVVKSFHIPSYNNDLLLFTWNRENMSQPGFNRFSWPQVPSALPFSFCVSTGFHFSKHVDMVGGGMGYPSQEFTEQNMYWADTTKDMPLRKIPGNEISVIEAWTFWAFWYIL